MTITFSVIEVTYAWVVRRSRAGRAPPMCPPTRPPRAPASYVPGAKTRTERPAGTGLSFVAI